MIWEINFTRSAEREFAKLPRDVKILIRNYLRQKVQDQPRDYGKALVGTNKIKLWRYRVQNYRIICEIIDKEISVLVIRIGKRDSVYDN
ncbi:MAG: type II toxin-antitoxin system RelE/ParE family toxin [Rickettsiaceae bacterium]